MKNFDLEAYGVSEMTQLEMMEVDGGNIFGDIWDGIKAAASWIAQTIADAIASLVEKATDIMWDNVLKNSTLGGGTNL
jgi:hypothetical protein